MSSELRELRAQIRRMSRSAAQVDLLETAVQLADAENNLDQGFELRMQLVNAAGFTGFPQKMIVAFSWCLSQVDLHPKKFRESDILWQYKWIVGALMGFPQVTRQQLDDSLADLQRRFERNGGSMRAVYKLQCTLGATLGDTDLIKAVFPLWKKTPRGAMTDCQACDTDQQFFTHVILGQDRRALQVASPILKGRLSCFSVPHTTRAMVLQPMMRVGRWDQAAEAHRLGLPRVTKKLEHLSYIHYHLIYQILTGHVAEAVKLFESHLAMALTATGPLDRYNFMQGGSFLFRRLRKLGRRKRKLRLPEAFPLFKTDGNYDCGELAAWFEGEVRALANQFDERSRNRFRNGQLDALNELEKLSPPDQNASE